MQPEIQDRGGHGMAAAAGIDSIATADESDIAKAEPYLKEAMVAVEQGQTPPHALTMPYGCSIKY